MDAAVRKLFERYERVFNQSLNGDLIMEEVTSLYTTDFIAASPAGVMGGRIDEDFKQVLVDGYEHYRAIGTKEMRIRDVRLSPIDDLHCVAHVAWKAVYARTGKPDATIDFDVHYLVHDQGGEVKVFGWVSGDEQALLKQHGII